MLRALLLLAALATRERPGCPAGVGWGDLGRPPVMPELSEAGGRMLRAHVEGGVDAELRWADFRDLRPELRRFYEARRLDARLDRRRARDQRRLAGGGASCMDAARKGLDPLDYGGDWERPARAAEQAAPASRSGCGRRGAHRLRAALRGRPRASVGSAPVPGTELLGRIQLDRVGGPAPDFVGAVGPPRPRPMPEACSPRSSPRWPVYRRTLAALAGLLALAAGRPAAAAAARRRGPWRPSSYAASGTLAERLRDAGDSTGPDAATGARQRPAPRRSPRRWRASRGATAWRRPASWTRRRCGS